MIYLCNNALGNDFSFNQFQAQLIRSDRVDLYWAVPSLELDLTLEFRLLVEILGQRCSDLLTESKIRPELLVGLLEAGGDVDYIPDGTVMDKKY